MTFEEWWESMSKSVPGSKRDIADMAWQAAQEQQADDAQFQLETLDELNYAVDLLARWCVAVDEGGAGWDYWDDYYKEAMHSPSPIRYQLDMRINYLRSENEQ